MRFLALLLLALTAVPATASPAAAVTTALADCRRLPKEVACRTRYLTLYNLPIEDRDRTCRVLSFQLNSLSREPDLTPPRRVGPDLVAVVLDDYAFDDKVWEKLARVDPYFHYWAPKVPSDGYLHRVDPFWLPADDLHELEKRTHSAAPVLRVDWWFAQTARQVDLNNKQQGIGYYDFLGIKNRADFERLGRFSEKDSIALGQEIRAAIEAGKSGVAQKDRQILRFQALSGPYWLTLDTDDNSGGNTAPGNLKPGEFRHKAEEGYIALKKTRGHLWATWAGDQKGNPQASAPDFIGPNDSPLRQGRDARIHVQVACIQCHPTGGLRDIDDWARRTLRQPLGVTLFRVKDEVRFRRQYFTDLKEQLEEDRRPYVLAVEQVTRLGADPGWTTELLAAEFSRVYYGYLLRPRDQATLALELGVPQKRLVSELKIFFDIHREDNLADRKLLAGISSLIAKTPDTVPVDYVEQFFGDLQLIARGRHP